MSDTCSLRQADVNSAIDTMRSAIDALIGDQPVVVSVVNGKGRIGWIGLNLDPSGEELARADAHARTAKLTHGFRVGVDAPSLSAARRTELLKLIGQPLSRTATRPVH